MSVKKILGVSFIALILVFLVIFKFVSCNKKKPVAVQTGAQIALPVDAFIVRDTSVTDRIRTIGTLEANESVEIVSEISKKVTGIFMKEGGYVEKGQLLFKLDDSDILAGIHTLKVEEELAYANEKREKALLAKGGISQETYDIASNRLNTIRARIAELEVQLAKTEIRAPFPGKIGLRNVSEGAWVTPALPLTDLQDIHRLKVIFTVPERYSCDIRNGLQVDVSTDFSPGVVTAFVDAAEPAVDSRTRTLRIQAVVDNRDVSLVPGISVNVDLTLRPPEKSLFIPTSALIPSQMGYSVFLVKEGKAVNVQVRTGLRTESAVQILENLNPGDTLITTNLLRVRQGIQVKIQTIG